MRLRRLRKRPEWAFDIVGYPALGLGLGFGAEQLVGLGFALIAVAWPVHFVRWRGETRRKRKPASVTSLVGRESRRARRRAA